MTFPAPWPPSSGITRSFDQNSFDALIPAILASKEDAVMAEMEDTHEREGSALLCRLRSRDLCDRRLKEEPGPTSRHSMTCLARTSPCSPANQQIIFVQKPTEEQQAWHQPRSRHSRRRQDCFPRSQSGKDVATMIEGPCRRSGRCRSSVAARPSRSSPIQKAPNGYSRGIEGIGIRKSNTQLVAAVQKAVQELMNDGTVPAKIFAKYSLFHETLPQATVNHPLH